MFSLKYVLSQNEFIQSLSEKSFKCKKCDENASPLDLLCPNCSKLIFGNDILNNIIFVSLFLIIPIFLTFTILIFDMKWPLHVYISSITILFFLLFFRNIPKLIFISFSWLLIFTLVDLFKTYFTDISKVIYLNFFQTIIIVFLIYRFIKWLISFYKTQDEYKFLVTMIIGSFFISLFFYLFNFFSSYFEEVLINNPDFYFLYIIGSHSKLYFQIRVIGIIISIGGLVIHAMMKYNKIGLIKSDKISYINSIERISKLEKEIIKEKKLFIKIMISLYLNFAKIIERILNILILIANKTYNASVTLYKNFVNLIEQIWSEIKHYIRIIMKLLKGLIVDVIFPIFILILLIVNIHYFSGFLFNYLHSSSFATFLLIILLSISYIIFISQLSSSWFRDFKINLENSYDKFLNEKKENDNQIASSKEKELKNGEEIDENNNNISTLLRLSTKSLKENIWEFLMKIIPFLVFFIIILIPFILLLIRKYFITQLEFHLSYFSFLGIFLLIIVIFTIFRKIKHNTASIE